MNNKTYRKITRLLFGITATLLVTNSAACISAADKRPNILFIAVDDLRPLLGCYGDQQVKSPNIDELAALGTVFKRAYCQVAVCGASRASLLTGLRPTPTRFLNYKSYAEKEAPGAMTLPEELRKSGYHCISNGKIFHHREDTADRSWSEEPWKASIGGATTLAPESKKMRGGTKNRGPIFESPDVPDNAYPDGMIADKTIDDLRRVSKQEKPFFLACGFLKPHLPFYAPKKYWDMYDRDKIKLAENQYRPKNAPKPLKGSTEIHSYHDRNIEYNSQQWHRDCRHGYFACVSYIDAQVGRVQDALDDLGLRDNTIVILWGDHGFHLGEHNFWGKHNVMHLSTNAPLIVSAPGYNAGQSCERLVEFVDIYPTLCELTGLVTENKSLHGTSFKPLLNSPTLPWKQVAYSKFSSARSMITERYNFGRFNSGETLLFDLANDPDENSNVAGQAEHQQAVKRLSQLLTQ